MLKTEPKWVTIVVALLPIAYGLAVAAFVVRGLLQARPADMTPVTRPGLTRHADSAPEARQVRTSFGQPLGWVLALAVIAILAILYAAGISDRLLLLLGALIVVLVVLIAILLSRPFSGRRAGTRTTGEVT